MGGMFRKPRIDTRAQEEGLARQEALLRQQEERLAAQEAEMRAREDSARQARGARLAGRRLLLGGEESGTQDQPLQTRLGG